MVGGAPGLGSAIRGPGSGASAGVSLGTAKRAWSVKGRRKRKELASSEEDSPKYVSTSGAHDLVLMISVSFGWVLKIAKIWSFKV